MLGEPSLLLGQYAAESQGEALFPEERVASVAGTERHNHILVGNVGYQRLLGIARPIIHDAILNGDKNKQKY